MGLGLIELYGNTVFDSKFGEKVLKIDNSGEKVKWTEKGLRRTFFWHVLIFLLGLKAVFFFAFSTPVSFLSVMLSVVVSFYMTEKTMRYMIPVFEEASEVEFESNDFRDTQMFRILKRTFDGEEPKKVMNDEFR